MNDIRFERFFEEHLQLVEPLTSLLHEAYAPLAARGMRYLATHQAASKTLERLNEGESYLGFAGDELVCTVSLYGEKPSSTSDYYRKPGVHSFGQFAVKKSRQGKGIGSKMMTMLEARAKERGARELALDTSEHAAELIGMYERRGYSVVSRVRWDVTNYLSVIMSKPL